jgi:hypothetical protein|tara:strand:- start:1156 stop:1365 length:210 start_codon:yes stop_codon:yes gene_type:complete
MWVLVGVRGLSPSNLPMEINIMTRRDFMFLSHWRKKKPTQAEEERLLYKRYLKLGYTVGEAYYKSRIRT